MGVKKTIKNTGVKKAKKGIETYKQVIGFNPLPTKRPKKK